METESVQSSDVDELVDRVTAILSTHRITHVRKTTLAARVDAVRSHGMALVHMDYGSELRVRADPLPGFFAVCVPMTGGMTVRHNGQRFDADAGGSALVGTPESELVLDWHESLTLQVIRVDKDALRSLANAFVGTELDADLRFDPHIRIPHVTGNALAQARLLHDIVETSTTAINSVTAARLREDLMLSLLVGQPNSYSTALRYGRPPSARRSKITDAVDLIHANASTPLTIEHIARTVGISVRALQDGFRRELDTSPKRYLDQVRLHGAHRELVRTDPASGTRVADIAARWGFHHPGRFAAAYRERYGQSPSVTYSRY